MSVHVGVTYEAPAEEPDQGAMDAGFDTDSERDASSDAGTEGPADSDAGEDANAAYGPGLTSGAADEPDMDALSVGDSSDDDTPITVGGDDAGGDDGDAAAYGGWYEDAKGKAGTLFEKAKDKVTTVTSGEGGQAVVDLAKNVFAELGALAQVSKRDVDNQIKELLAVKEELRLSGKPAIDNQVFAIDLLISILRSAFHDRYAFLRKGGGTISREVFGAWSGMHMACLTSPQRSCEALRYTGK